MNSLLFLVLWLQETVAFILGPCTHGNEINATFAFSSLWNYLRASASLAVLGGW
jgi:hypothetical protein